MIHPAGRADAAAWHEVAEAARRADDPTHPPVPLVSTDLLLRAEPYDGRVLRWLSRTDSGEPAGTAEVFLPATANLGWGFTTVTVHPGHRRRGHGRLLLQAVLAELAAQGRETAVLTTNPQTGAGDWAAAMGGTKVQQLLESALDVSLATIPEPTVPNGYRLDGWIGACPPPLLDTFARAKDAMNDAPDGGLGYETTSTTVGRVRLAERAREERELDLYVVVAVHEASGEIAGLTEIEVDRNCPELGHQEDTAVVPAHRGHGIGLWIKSEMVRRFDSMGVPVRSIRTTTDFSNAYMLAINERLGFVRTGVCEQWTVDVA